MELLDNKTCDVFKNADFWTCQAIISLWDGIKEPELFISFPKLKEKLDHFDYTKMLKCPVEI